MLQIRTIRRLLAGIILVLFVLGNTPRVAIHALVARHTDVHLRLGHERTDQYNKDGFHCDTESQVINQSFPDYSFSIQIGMSPVYPEHCPAVLAAPLVFSHPLFGLRGPPATFSI